MKAKDLIGKTITNATQKRQLGEDAIAYLELEFSDNTMATIVVEDEYPVDIHIMNGIILGLRDKE